MELPTMEPRPIRRLAEEVVNRVAAGEARAPTPASTLIAPPLEPSVPSPPAHATLLPCLRAHLAALTRTLTTPSSPTLTHLQSTRCH